MENHNNSQQQGNENLNYSGQGAAGPAAGQRGTPVQQPANGQHPGQGPRQPANGQYPGQGPQQPLNNGPYNGPYRAPQGQNQMPYAGPMQRPNGPRNPGPYGYPNQNPNAAPAPGGYTPVPKKKRGKIIALVILALVLVAAIIFAAVMLWPSSPQNTVAEALGNTEQALLGRSDIGAFMKASVGAQSSSATVRMEDAGPLFAELSGSSMLKNLSVNAAVTVSSNLQRESSVSLSLDMFGIALDAQVYASPTALIISAPDVLDQNYGIPLENVSEAMENSIFAPDSGSDYALYSEDYDALMEILERMENPLEGMEEQPLNAAELQELLFASLEAEKEFEALFVKEKKPVMVGGESVDCTVISASIDTATMKRLVSFYENFFDTYGGQVLEAFHEGYDGDFAADLEDMVDENEVTTEIAYSIYKDHLVRVDVLLVNESEDEEMSIVLDLGTDPATSEEMYLLIDDGGDETCYTYRLLQNTETTYAAELEYSSQTIEILTDKSTGETTVTLYYDGEESGSISGTVNVDETVLSLALDSVTSYGKTLDLSAFSMELSNEGAVTPIEGEYKSIFELTEAEMDDLIGGLENVLTDMVLSSFIPMG